MSATVTRAEKASHEKPRTRGGENIEQRAVRDAKERARKRTLREAVGGWGLLTPALIVLGVMVGYPAVLMVIQSFTNLTTKNKVQGTLPDFVGFDNYIDILTQSDFPMVLARSLGLMVVITACIMLLGTLIAVIMTKLSKWSRIMVSVGLLLAWSMPPLASTVVWGWIFDTQYGVVNWALNTITGTNDFTNHGWLANPWTFMAIVVIIVVWMGVPFVVFTLYAALGQVPGEVLEAAALDGTTGLRRFRYIVFPYLRSVFTVVLILQVIWNLNIFTQVYALQSRGGTASETNVLGTYLYRLGAGDYGMTSAIGVIMVVILLTLSIGYIRNSLKEEEQ